MSRIAAKIFRAGTDGMEISLESGQTVEDALQKSGLNKKSSEIIQINGKIKSIDTEVQDGDVIILAKNIEGGSI